MKNSLEYTLLNTQMHHQPCYHFQSVPVSFFFESRDFFTRQEILVKVCTLAYQILHAQQGPLYQLFLWSTGAFVVQFSTLISTEENFIE